MVFHFACILGRRQPGVNGGAGQLEGDKICRLRSEARNRGEIQGVNQRLRSRTNMVIFSSIHFPQGISSTFVASGINCGEGNGNPLQCSCLENPRDRGAWWAAVYGFAQSLTWLKWSSSSSSRPLLNFHINSVVVPIFQMRKVRHRGEISSPKSHWQVSFGAGIGHQIVCRFCPYPS